jgi:uncharacterized protein YjbI with pentapeptide repeats
VKSSSGHEAGSADRRDDLETFLGSLEIEGDYDSLAFRKVDLTAQDGEGAHFEDCVLIECMLDEVRLNHARILETTLTGSHATTLELLGATLRDVTFADCRIGALASPGSKWTQVRIRGGKLDYVNLRDGQLDSVNFENCFIGELDLSGAIVTRLVLIGCRVGQLTLTHAQLKDTDLRGAELSSVTGLMELAGATITNVQLHDLAPALAAHFQITVA